MTRQPDQNAIRAFVRDSFEGTGAPPGILDQAVAFLAAWSRLDIRQQFALQQRVAFSRTLEDAAREYVATFHEGITAAGVSASCAAASKAAQAFLAPGLLPTTPAPTNGDASRGTSARSNCTPAHHPPMPPPV